MFWGASPRLLRSGALRHALKRWFLKESYTKNIFFFLNHGKLIAFLRCIFGCGDLRFFQSKRGSGNQSWIRGREGWL